MKAMSRSSQKGQIFTFINVDEKGVGESTHIAPGFVNAPMLLSQKL